ncbi:LysR family transcriptional regulator [Paenibacillus rhizovicinus]|uniref:LysR family transcriptional regulator n=1 Tax=Paenibacillus rhizovicinus TaxID=2704463 RepID=A0A6C0P644_9BACL|nr:LysR family transcriptional regulator [Paenibacillus rhizovicinus]QHW34054.1 LysR family transcriptional regulator [Paenibacillus rhizovicinus]
MDLKELITFRTIVREGTFSKAAAVLNYAQSTVTNQVQRLEKELGLQLFTRGWDAELTEAGRRYADEVDKLIAHWQYVIEQAKALRQEEIGELRIGLIEPLAEGVLPAVMRNFGGLKPNISGHFTIGNTDTLAEDVRRQTIHAAVCGEPADTAGLSFSPLYNERVSFIAAADHPLASMAAADSALPLAALNDHPLILGGKTCLYHLKVQRAFSRIEASPFTHTVSRIASIPAMIREIPAIGAVLESTALPVGVVRLPVQLETPEIPVGILQPRSTDYVAAPLRLFLQGLRDEIGKRSPLRPA